MTIKEDKSLVNQKLIDMGLAELDIHSVRIDRYYSEEEKQQNYEMAQTMNAEKWSVHCSEERKRIASIITNVMNTVNSNFTVYQYTNLHEYKSSWELFFWCNNLHNTTNGKESGRDMSYVTLTFNDNDKVSTENRRDVLERLINLLSKCEEHNIQAIIQYTAKENNDAINDMAASVFNDIEDKFVSLNGYGVGKVKQVENRYAFFKKGAKRNYYGLSPLELCTMISA